MKEPLTDRDLGDENDEADDSAFNKWNMLSVVYTTDDLDHNEYIFAPDVKTHPGGIYLVTFTF